MENFIYKDSSVKVSEKGIYLLRNEFVYQFIDFNNVEKIILKKDHTIKNWILSCVLGSVFIIFSIIFYVYSYFNILDSLKFPLHSSFKLGFTAIASVLFILIAGVLLLRFSLYKSIVLEIKQEKRKKSFQISLIKLKKIESSKSLISFFENAGIKHCIIANNKLAKVN